MTATVSNTSLLTARLGTCYSTLGMLAHTTTVYHRYLVFSKWLLHFCYYLIVGIYIYDTWYLILGTWYLILGTYYLVLWMLPTPLITVYRVASSVTSHANRLLFHTRVLIAAVVVSSTMMTKKSGERDSPKYSKGHLFIVIFFQRRSYILKCYCSPNGFYKDNVLPDMFFIISTEGAPYTYSTMVLHQSKTCYF